MDGEGMMRSADDMLTIESLAVSDVNEIKQKLLLREVELAVPWELENFQAPPSSEPDSVNEIVKKNSGQVPVSNVLSGGIKRYIKFGDDNKAQNTKYNTKK
ncbi:hypothetical protein DPMN_038125 [Dreissena polymorpha]|uniref:Uncharacterized protein n=1 Tax=Dreissena polymorpha TaxID=45954 RepID=A0A9D4MEU8_DREPO|nr:hypothetical protein DPMN_038125 [Dreissena polymorpha]